MFNKNLAGSAEVSALPQSPGARRDFVERGIKAVNEKPLSASAFWGEEYYWHKIPRVHQGILDNFEHYFVFGKDTQLHSLVKSFNTNLADSYADKYISQDEGLILAERMYQTLRNEAAKRQTEEEVLQAVFAYEWMEIMNAKQLIRLFAELHIDVEKYTALANDTVASRLDGKDLAYLRKIRSELYTVTDPIPEHGEEPKEKKGILARLKEMLG